MKTRSAVTLVGLVIGFALPIFAQQEDVADPQKTLKILALFKGLDEAINNTDAATIAALYTRNGVMVTTEGPIIGRQAIQKWFTDLYQRWHPKNSASHSEIFYRGVEAVAPQRLRDQVGRECLTLDRYGWQRSVGNRRME
jgi:hypothetical protein